MKRFAVVCLMLVGFSGLALAQTDFAAPGTLQKALRRVSVAQSGIQANPLQPVGPFSGKTNLVVDSTFIDSGPYNRCFSPVLNDYDAGFYYVAGTWQDTVETVLQGGGPGPDYFKTEHAQFYDINFFGYDSVQLLGIHLPIVPDGQGGILISFIHDQLGSEDFFEIKAYANFNGLPGGLLGSQIYQPTAIGNLTFQQDILFDTPLNITSTNGDFYVAATVKDPSVSTNVDSVFFCSSNPYEGYGQGLGRAFWRLFRLDNSTYSWRDLNTFFQEDPPGTQIDLDFLMLPILKVFTTLTSTDAYLEQNILRVYNAYPNPANEATNVDFQLKEASKVRIQVYNTAGQAVISQELGQLPANVRHSQTLNTSSLANGTYYLSVQSTAGIITTQMVVQH